MAKGKAKPEPPPVIYADTCVFLDLFTHNETPHPVTGEPRWKIAKALLDAVNDSRVVLGTSALVDAELGCFAALDDDGLVLMDQVRGWMDASATRYADVDRVVAREAARLQKTWREYAATGKKMSGADAVHLAAAVRLGCGYLMTHDEGFPLGQTVDGVRVRHPELVWTPTMFDDA